MVNFVQVYCQVSVIFIISPVICNASGFFYPFNLPLYVVSLVERKTKAEYNITMQLLRYMVHIWEDYENDMNKLYPNISS